MATEPRDRFGRMYHIALSERDVGEIALLPGDPDRVPRIAKHFRDAKLISSHREYTCYGGYVDDKYVISMSTGIGGPSTAIAVEELARLGVSIMIRVGTCGAINKRLRIGSLIIADSAVRLDGTTKQYVIDGFPAVATPELVLSLRDSAISLGKEFSIGTTASTDSFYVGQGRKGFNNYFPSHVRSLIDDLSSANVLCFEMESSTLFTLGRIYGLKTGAIFAVVANRATDEFRVDAGVDDAIEVAVNSIRYMKNYLK